MVIDEGFPRMLARLSQLDGVVVAYSGGVDSSVVAVAAHRALGSRMVAVLAVSPLLPAEEVAAARRVAAEQGFPLVEVVHPGLGDPAVSRNSRDRCFACKRALMPVLQRVADERGFSAIAHGENADDQGAHRPGSRAAQEAGVLSPLADAGFRKQDVRAIARELGLSNADKPSTPCLATRFPYDTTLDEVSLLRVEHAEKILRETFGLRVFRVRCEGDLARLEIANGESERTTERDSALLATLLQSGFARAEIDPTGYRSGSFDARP